MKYIVGLPEKYIEKRSDGGEWLQMPVNVCGHNVTIKTVVPLTPYTEPDLEAIKQEAYQNGLNDAWDAARWLSKTNVGVNFEVFDMPFTSEIVQKISASEAIDKIQQYEQGQEEIEYGDEIQFCDGEKALVLDVDDEKLSVVTKRGFTDVSMWKGNVTKTGEKYIIIADYLRKIRDGYEF